MGELVRCALQLSTACHRAPACRVGGRGPLHLWKVKYARDRPKSICPSDLPAIIISTMGNNCAVILPFYVLFVVVDLPSHPLTVVTDLPMPHTLTWPPVVTDGRRCPCSPSQPRRWSLTFVGIQPGMDFNYCRIISNMCHVGQAESNLE